MITVSHIQFFCCHYSYTRELPSRFRKDIVRAATLDESNRIVIEGMQQVLININMEHKVSENDMKTIFREVGQDGEISVDKMLQII